MHKLSFTKNLIIFGLLFITIGFITVLHVKAGYRPGFGGEYKNLCGDPSGNNYNCPASCSPSNGTCSTGSGGGNYIFRYTCDGELSTGSTCVSNEERLGWGTHSVNTNQCGKTIQVDVFTHDCRAGGGWSCGGSDLKGYMLWYSGDCPPPSSNQVSVSGRVYCQDNNQGLSGRSIFLNDLSPNNVSGQDYTVNTDSAGNYGVNNFWTTAGDNRYDIELNNGTAGWNGPYTAGCPSHCQGGCNSSNGGQGVEFDECTNSENNFNFYFTNCAPPTPTPTPIPNNPPRCQNMNINVPNFNPGDTVTVTGNATDTDGTVNRIGLFWAPAVANYCSASWTLIDNNILPGGGGNWTYNWNTSGFTYDGQIMLAANVRDDDNAWCTGNPSATTGNNSCGSGLAVCRNPNTPNGCNGTVTAIQNQVPTAGANITSNETCNINGNTISGQISGEFNDTNNTSLNNPLTVVTTHTDPNGAADIDLMGIWITETANGHPNIPSENSQAAFARVRRVGASNFQKLAYGNGAISTSDVRVVATMSGNNNQQFRNTNSLGSAVAYANPLSINESGNTITITWEVALINSAVFDGNLVAFALTQDQAGTTPVAGSPTWVQSGQTWVADLQPPSVNPSLNNLPVNPQFLPGNQIQVTWGATDNRQVYANGYSKLCGADNLLPGEDITLNGSLVHGSNNNLVTCFNNTVNPPPRTDTYTITDNSSSGNLLFSLGVADTACNTINSTPVSVSIPDPWLMTSLGDTFSNEYDVSIPVIVQNTNLAIENGAAPNLSTYLYLQLETGPLPANASKNNFDRAVYDDLNTLPRVPGAGNWYNYLKAKVMAEADHTQTQSTLGLGGSVSGLFSTGPNDQDIYAINVTGPVANITSLNCNIKAVFLIDGDLNLYPDQLINSADDGCVFIVQGKTTVHPGANKGSNDTTPITNYDIVEAFIITDEFESIADPNGDGLLIEGGVITTIVDQTTVSTFGRDLGLIRNQEAPAEIFRYDGVRYMYLFGDLFTYEKNFNIREKQFIKSLEN